MLTKINIIFLCLVTLLSTSGWAFAEEKRPYTQEVIKARAIKKINDAARWSIENGIMEYYRHNKKWIQKKTLHEWAVSTSTGPIIDSDMFMARFMIKAAGIYCELLVLERLEYNNSVYEYWVQKVSGSDLPGKVDWYSTFIVTRADNVRGKREVLKEEPQFFKSYQIDNSEILKFPVDDLESLFFLEAWLYSYSYQNSNIKDYKVICYGPGEFVKKKLSWFEKMHIKIMQ